MSSCFSGGGGRTYAFELDIVKSSSTTSTRTNSQTSSPSSTLSESSNSPLAISTRKPRTPRKRPNQTYNEAAALLSTAYPNIFSPKTLSNPLRKSTAKPHLDHPSDFLLPFRLVDNSTAVLLHNPVMVNKPTSRFEPKAINSFDKVCHSPGEFNSPVAPMDICDDNDDFDFDAESILEEEIEEGIDSIMGTSSTTSSMNIESVDETSTTPCDQMMMSNSCYGYPMGLGFGANLEFGFGFRLGGVRPLRQVDDGVNWWSFPTVDVLEISPRFNKSMPSAPSGSRGKNKKKKTKMSKLAVVESKLAEKNSKKKTSQIEEVEEEEEMEEEAEECGKLMLKLDYDDVLSAWSDKASPLPEELQGGGDGGDGNDVSVCFSSLVRQRTLKNLMISNSKH